MEALFAPVPDTRTDYPAPRTALSTTHLCTRRRASTHRTRTARGSPSRNSTALARAAGGHPPVGRLRSMCRAGRTGTVPDGAATSGATTGVPGPCR